MSRPPNPLQGPAITALLKHLSVGADVALVRSKFAQVPRQTWDRWVRTAVAQHRDQGGVAPPKEAPPPPPLKRAAPRPTPATPGPSVPPPSKKKPKTGELMPPEGSAPVTPFDSRVSEDGSLYVIKTMFGDKEFPIVSRWVDPPGMDAHDALAVIDRLGEQYLNADALMKASMKRAGDGHVILDPSAYAAAVDLQHKVLVSLHKVLKDSRNIDSARRFVAALVETLKTQDPAFAKRVIELIRTAASSFAQVTHVP